MSDHHKNLKPLFKYIGGKTWLKKELRKSVELILENNKNLSAYVEPFAGGLGAFLGVYDILLENNINKVILSDVNSGLIFLYNDIRNNKDDLIKSIVKIERDFSETIPKSLKNNKDKTEVKRLLEFSEIFFKAIRKDFNDQKGEPTVVQSARLMFLQKHSFNGVYRENSRGQYNTPFNWNGSVMFDTIENKINDLNEVFNLFDIQFNIGSYNTLDYTSDKIYYLDPPYINESITENKYNKDSFGLKEQLNLINKIKGLNFLYSNHYSETLIKELNLNKNIFLQKVYRKNIMSASSESRKDDKAEILATNIV